MYHTKGRDLLVADVNAVIAGLFDGGATEVHLLDGHGSGNPQPDVQAGKLDPRAKQLISDQPLSSTNLAKTGNYDAVALVGMHAKTGSGGFAAHTGTFGVEVEVNGRTVTESETFALVFGGAGVPVIFVSGDDRLGNNLRTMPWLQFAEVKQALAADKAKIYPVDKTHQLMRAKARDAVLGLADAKIITAVSPVKMTVRAYPPADLSHLKGLPGVDYQDDNSISVVGEDIYDARARARPIYGEISGPWTYALRRIVTVDPLASASQKPAWLPRDIEEINAAIQVWIDQENGQYKPETESHEKNKKYHGAR